MQLAHPVVNTLFGPLKKGIVGLGGVVVHLTAGKLFLPMTDCFVSCEILSDNTIGLQLVAHKMGLGADGSLNEGLQHGHTATAYELWPEPALDAERLPQHNSLPLSE